MAAKSTATLERTGAFRRSGSNYGVKRVEDVSGRSGPLERRDSSAKISCYDNPK